MKLTNHLPPTTNWLRYYVSRQAVRLQLLSYADKELTDSLVLASDWLSNISVCFGLTKRDSEKEVTIRPAICLSLYKSLAESIDPGVPSALQKRGKMRP